MLKTEESIAQRFARDVESHVMDIRHDEGLYRHVVFKRPNTSCMLFSLTTTPGRLIYAGDMGCFVFERIEDMFKFFRYDPDEREPNFDYWHQKLVAICRHGSEQPSVGRFRANLESYLTDDMSEDNRAQVVEFISEAASVFDDEGPQVAYSMVNDFSLDNPKCRRLRFFQDFFEYSDKVFTLQYQWACYAIPWGIKLYDAK